MRNYRYLVTVFPNFSIAKTMSITNYFTSNMRMVYLNSIGHYSLQILDKIFGQKDSFYLICSTEFDH